MADDDGNYDDDGDDEYWQEEGYSNWLSGNEDEHGFDGYQVSTIDPSPVALIITFLLSILAILLIPFCVAVREKYKKERFRRQLQHQQVAIQSGTRNDKDTSKEWTPYVAPTDADLSNESVEVWHENTQEFMERVKQGAKITSTKIRAKKQQEDKQSLSMNDVDATQPVRDGLLKTTPNTPISLHSIPSPNPRPSNLVETSLSPDEFSEEEFSDEDDDANISINDEDHVLKYYGLDNEMPGGNSIELQMDTAPGEKRPQWWTKWGASLRARQRRLQGAAKVVSNSIHILEPKRKERKRMQERRLQGAAKVVSNSIHILEPKRKERKRMQEPLLFERPASKQQQQEEPTLPWPLNDPQEDSSKQQEDSSKQQLEVDVNSNPVQQDMEPSTSYVNDMMQEMGMVNHKKDSQTTNDGDDDDTLDEVVQAIEEDLLFNFDDELSQGSLSSSYRHVSEKKKSKKVYSDVVESEPSTESSKKQGVAVSTPAAHEEALEKVELVDVPRGTFAEPSVSVTAPTGPVQETTLQNPTADVVESEPSTESSKKQGVAVSTPGAHEEALEKVELVDVPRGTFAEPSVSVTAPTGPVQETTLQNPTAAAVTTTTSSSKPRTGRRSSFLGLRFRKQEAVKRSASPRRHSLDNQAIARHHSTSNEQATIPTETRVPVDQLPRQEPELPATNAREVLILPTSPNAPPTDDAFHPRVAPDRASPVHKSAQKTTTTLVPVDRAADHDYIEMKDEDPTASNTKESSKLVKSPSVSPPSDKEDLQTPQQTPLATDDGYYVLMDGDDQNNESASALVPRAKKKVNVNLCCGKRPWWRFLCSRRFRRKVSKCATWDAEMDALLGLALPFTLHTIVANVLGLMEVAVIGRMLGTQSLAAFYSVSFIYTLSTMLMEGAHTSLLTLCSHAIGAKRYYLAGQMVQIAAVIYQVMLIPFAITFVYFLEDIVEWLGFDEQVADMAYRYAILVYAAEFINPLDEGLYYLLDVTGHEIYATIMGLASSSTSFVCVLCVGLFLENPSLQEIGLVHMAIDVVFFLLNVCLIYYFTWFDKYWAGILGNFALAETRAVRLFLKQAVPLSLGYVMAYGEWEVLFVFAGYMGPAEVAVWGLLGDIWESLEEIGLATADAAEVRVANLMGSDQPQRARYCAHKSVVVSVLVAILCSVPIYACSEQIPSWFTKDETLQEMFKTLIPYACLGNVTMMFGSVSWTLLGAQGRFGLATAMGFIGSWGVTLPLSAISTLVLGYDLQGLASSVVIGYACSGALNSYFLVRSNWEKLSLKIQRKNRSEEKQFQSKSLKTQMEETEKEYIPQPMNLEDLDWNELPEHGTFCLFLILW